TWYSVTSVLLSLQRVAGEGRADGIGRANGGRPTTARRPRPSSPHGRHGKRTEPGQVRRVVRPAPAESARSARWLGGWPARAAVPRRQATRRRRTGTAPGHPRDAAGAAPASHRPGPGRRPPTAAGPTPDETAAAGAVW